MQCASKGQQNHGARDGNGAAPHPFSSSGSVTETGFPGPTHIAPSGQPSYDEPIAAWRLIATAEGKARPSVGRHERSNRPRRLAARSSHSNDTSMSERWSPPCYVSVNVPASCGRYGWSRRVDLAWEGTGGLAEPGYWPGAPRGWPSAIRGEPPGDLPTYGRNLGALPFAQSGNTPPL